MTGVEPVVDQLSPLLVSGRFRSPSP